jgi:fibronectin-binding autotransporter adhesin
MKPNARNQFARVILSIVAAPMGMVFASSLAHAATTYSGAGDDWANETNWTPNVVPDGPAGAFNQRLNFTGNTTVTFTAAQGTVELASSATADARAFVIGNTNPNPGATSVLNITGGVLRANSAANNASTSTSSLVGANGPNSNGTLNVSGTGTLDLTPAAGASHRILSLGLGGTANTGISGTVNLSGSGLIKVGQFRFAENAPNTGGSITGILNLNGGTLETGAIQETAGTTNALVSSTVNLNGGLLRLTGATGISASLDTVNILSAGADIEVVTGVTAACGAALLDGGGNGGLTKSGPGTLSLTATNSYTGNTSVNQGSLSVASSSSLPGYGTPGRVSVDSGATLVVGNSFVSADLNTLLANATFAAGSSFGFDTTAGDRTYPNAISTSLGLTKLGANALFLDQGNAYNGTTNIAAGALNIQHPNALGTTDAGTTVANGASLQVQGGISIATESLSIASGSSTTPLVRGVSGDNTLNGAITTTGTGAAARLASNAGLLTVAGEVSSSGTQLVLQGEGGILVSGKITGTSAVTSSSLNNSGATAVTTAIRTLANPANDFTGNLNMNGGTIRIGAGEVIPNGAGKGNISFPTSTVPATFDLHGNSETINGLTGAAGMGTVENTALGAATLTIGDNDTTSAFDGVIKNTGGALGIEKIGSGAVTLSGPRTNSGNTTVTLGILILGNAPDPLNANDGNDTSTVAIAASGATLNLTYTGTDKVDKLFIGATQLAAGVYGKEGSASPINGIPQITGDGTLTVASGPGGGNDFTTWAASRTPPVTGGANGDDDLDGVENLIEYALADGGERGTYDADTNTLTFTKRGAPYGGDITYAIEISTSLAANSWSPATVTENSSLISFSFTPVTPPKQFARLKVLRVP